MVVQFPLEVADQVEELELMELVIMVREHLVKVMQEEKQLLHHIAEVEEVEELGL